MSDSYIPASTLAMKQFMDEDEKSATFSVDPHMYQKLGIKKAKEGEQSDYDIGKLYEFQLNKDIEKIRNVKGTFATRNTRYVKMRESDPLYNQVAQPKLLGNDGNFITATTLTVEASWKATTQPYGEIAHKRYLEYLASIPKGPTEEEILAKAQHDMDHELWAKIISGRLDPTRKELIASYDKLERDAEDKINNAVDDPRFNKLARKRLIAEGQFEKVRLKPTKREFLASVNNWFRGIYYPYNYDKGYPLMSVDSKTILRANGMVVRDKAEFERFIPNATYSSENFIHPNDRFEQDYKKYLIKINYQRAQAFLKLHRKKVAEALKKKEEEREAARLTRRKGEFSPNNMIIAAKAREKIIEMNHNKSIEEKVVKHFGRIPHLMNDPNKLTDNRRGHVYRPFHSKSDIILDNNQRYPNIININALESFSTTLAIIPKQIRDYWRNERDKRSPTVYPIGEYDHMIGQDSLSYNYTKSNIFTSNGNIDHVNNDNKKKKSKKSRKNKFSFSFRKLFFNTNNNVDEIDDNSSSSSTSDDDCNDDDNQANKT
eukprot:gene8877-11974_t